jgi:hypothetical protein
MRWLVLLVVVVACGEPDSAPRPCGGGVQCPTGEVCIHRGGKAQCAPKCVDGGCPTGMRCEDCLGSGDCPVCAVCVQACVR